MIKDLEGIAVSGGDIRPIQKATLGLMKTIRTNVRLMIPFYDGRDMIYIDEIMEDAIRMLVGSMTEDGSVEAVNSMLHAEGLDDLIDG